MDSENYKYSGNQKISIRQVGRLLILDLFGASSLLLPGVLARTAGKDGIFCIMAAALLALVYLWILGKVLKRQQGDYGTWIRQTAGGLLGDIILIFYFFFFVLVAAFLLYQLTSLIRVWLLPEGSYGWISFLILFVAAYSNLRGIEGRARIYEILFWFLGAPLLFMLLLAVRDVDVNDWTPIVDTAPREFLQGTLGSFVFFIPVFFIPFLKNSCSKPHKLTACAGKAVGVAAFLNIVIYLILTGIFQVKTTAILERPVITLMSMVKLPGGFFIRLDAFMTAIWFFSLFALMNTGVFWSGQILKGLFGEKRTQYGLVAALLLVFSTARWFWNYPGAVELYEKFLVYIAVWILLLLPILVWCMDRIRDRVRKNE